MNKTQIKRIFVLGLLNVIRNYFVSLSVVIVISVSLFVVGLSILFSKVVEDTIIELRDKVDITVYFTTNAEEEEILKLKDRLELLSQVEKVSYVSKISALEEYRKRHENDVDILKGLEILDTNPFRARLSINSYDSGDFEDIARFIENEDILSTNERTLIDKIDYYQNRDVIERLTSVTDTASFFVKLIILVLMAVSFLVVFNIIRLIIYTNRSEIKVMRLIGADKWYIRSPFLVSGGFYGVLGALISVIVIYPVSYSMSKYVENFFGGDGLIFYFINNFFYISIVLILFGFFIGVTSSYLSTIKYLED